jgi:hypothetical protein
MTSNAQFVLYGVLGVGLIFAFGSSLYVKSAIQTISVGDLGCDTCGSSIQFDSIMAISLGLIGSVLIAISIYYIGLEKNKRNMISKK